MLHFSEFSAAAEPVGGKAVTQGMWRYIVRKTGFIRVRFDDQPKPLTRELLSTVVEEECIYVSVFDKVWPAVLQVICQYDSSVFFKGQDTGRLVFAQA
jgi:hypothetical protein